MNNFKGNTAWPTINIIPVLKPIKYLEIGAFYGANVATYGLHHCVDPWDYTDYPEYTASARRLLKMSRTPARSTK